MSDRKKKRRIDNLRQFVRGHYAYNSVLEALNHAETAASIDHTETDSGIAIQGHWTTFVVAYSRPFEHSRHFGVEKRKVVREELRDLHDEIITRYRNQTIAHIDPTNNELNEMIFHVNEGTLMQEAQRFHPESEYLQACVELASSTLEKLSELQASRLCNFPESSLLSDGLYKFDQEAGVGKEWVKQQ